VVKAALRHNAASVIVAHNHPSGDPEPSEADLELTRALDEALGMIDVDLLDHFVVAGHRVLLRRPWPAVMQAGLASRKPAWDKAESPMTQVLTAMPLPIVKSIRNGKTQLFFASH
jgi:DNA repair protein RadC